MLMIGKILRDVEGMGRGNLCPLSEEQNTSLRENLEG
jgi:hypothetical protein